MKSLLFTLRATTILLISQNVQNFINRKDLSLPEKQAALAQLLGTDDELLKGYQFLKSQLTIDDCDSEAVNLYIQENNKLIERHADSNGEVIVTPAVLHAPSYENGNVYLPIDELKKLRADIRESTNYIRQKSKELDEILTEDPIENDESTISNIEAIGPKFENISGIMKGNAAIGCISDSDAQPLLVRSKLGLYAICIIGLINNRENGLSFDTHYDNIYQKE